MLKSRQRDEILGVPLASPRLLPESPEPDSPPIGCTKGLRYLASMP